MLRRVTLLHVHYSAASALILAAFNHDTLQEPLTNHLLTD
jgi:hypothetical protein